MPSAVDLAHLARRVNAARRLNGQVTLRSGLSSSTYFDKYLFEGDPRLLRDISVAAADVIPSNTEVLAGLELGGVPGATALSLATGIPVAFVRKEPKSYGTAKLAEGASVEGRRVLIVEDIVTTGGQVVISCEALRQLGASIDTALCIIDRSAGSHELGAANLRLISLLTSTDLEHAA